METRAPGAAWLVLFCGLLLSGCGAQEGVSVDDRPYYERAHLQVSDGLLVEVAALSSAESAEIFGADLNSIDVQPVWIRIENGTEIPQWLFPVGVDRDYFPPYEVARRASLFSELGTDELFRRLRKLEIRYFVRPKETAVGFVFAHSDEGMKALDVELHGPRDVHRFHFVVPVPGLPADFFDLEIDEVTDGEAATDLTLDGLRDWLETLPCCPGNAAEDPGDPVNLVFVGSLEAVRAALISQGWDVTAPVTGASLWRMSTAFLFGARYRYAPISPLFLFGREQDLAFQKSRLIIDERNHMRLWLAPVTFEGTSVWIGQISRDVGVKFSGRLWPPTTHVIDPDVDDARFFVLQDLIEGQSIYRLGFVRGQAGNDSGRPYLNAEKDPYFTDGLKAVFFISDAPVDPPDLELLDWRFPPSMATYRDIYNGPR